MLQLVLLLVLCGGLTSAEGPKVGILHMHGLNEHFDIPDHVNFKNYIEEQSGIPVHLIDTFNGLSSLTPLEKQVPVILKKVKEISSQYDHVIAVGYSQGGIIWRALIEEWDDHNVHTFISLASPQHGIAGAPPLLKKMVPLVDNLSRTPTFFLFVYSIVGQNLAPLNYYFDPYHYRLYLLFCNFFPRLNNEKGTASEKARRKENFLRLRKMVLVGGPDEDALRPWQSAQFGYYSKRGNRAEEVIPMEETRLYTEDLFGLKTLDRRGGVVKCTVEGLDHSQFRDDERVMGECVLPAVEEAILSA